MDFILENELARFIGVSNFGKDLVEEAQSYSKYKIVNNQIHLSLSAREWEKDATLDYCRKHDILVTAYRPTGKGSLATAGHPLLDALAVKYGRTPVQIALNWVIQTPNIVTLFKTSNLTHLQENLGALGWSLTAEDWQELDRNFFEAQLSTAHA